MILITSTSEFLLYFTVIFFLVSFHCKKKKNCCRIVSVLFCVTLFLLQESMFQCIRNREGKLIKVSILQEPNSELNINLRPMEHLEEEHHGQYPVERNPNACRSMRDYRNPPWVSTPSPTWCPQKMHHMEMLSTLVVGTTQIPQGIQDLHSMHLLHIHSMPLHLSPNQHSQPLQWNKSS